jgi:hypothetical protein
MGGIAVSAKLTNEQSAALDDAFSALQPFYDPGDDGDGVRLALNAIAGILGSKADIEVESDDGLNGVLEALEPGSELRETIDKLYKVAGEGSYGDGLTAKGANQINDLVQDIEGPLVALITRARPKNKPRAKARARKFRSRKS